MRTYRSAPIKGAYQEATMRNAPEQVINIQQCMSLSGSREYRGFLSYIFNCFLSAHDWGDLSSEMEDGDTVLKR
jgi:hypothetical protein